MKGILFCLLVVLVHPTLSQEDILKLELKKFRENFLSNHSSENTKTKRAACDDGKGNYGINSFNFLAFILLTFNIVANVNNNLNNNNNNKNDQNINAISQNSNNVATNTNAGNAIGVTVLPIPGKRSIDIWRKISNINEVVMNPNYSFLSARELSLVLLVIVCPCPPFRSCQTLSQRLTFDHFWKVNFSSLDKL